MANPIFKIYDKVVVFDGNEWAKKGDVGDNAKYYKEAQVIGVRHVILYEGDKPEYLIDVKFNDGRVSKGHFERGVCFLLG